MNTRADIPEMSFYLIVTCLVIHVFLILLYCVGVNAELLRFLSLILFSRLERRW
jgi:hypothetical protein